ncbi:hypothetical protein M378DRAFT_164183 [Amanita muscaria Koide BX008]|uniref:Uncharacterized protein n=1 Tax=Amanita muscaria (strain Koide BX008) TaxID=946122 RepID=A0A0C2TAJ1_AMAMK|nr:hypothetical protein M378DRAFT_164183 [Amanita muscaria Koide BX008]
MPPLPDFGGNLTFIDIDCHRSLCDSPPDWSSYSSHYTSVVLKFPHPASSVASR